MLPKPRLGSHQERQDGNCIPANIDEPAQELADFLIAKHQRPDLLNAFFQNAQLPL
jgi:hypothetical protein